ncbi:MAG: MEDS domain-containing protein [Longimicrobiales bacterium]
MPRREKTIDLGLRGMRGAEGDHIAYFWETPEEFAEAVGFLEAGMRGQDHLVIFGHDEANERICDVIEASGSSCETLVAAGRLSVLGPESTGELMLSRIGATFQKALDSGSSMIRLLGNIGWGRQNWPDERDILRFEAKVTAAAASFPCIVVCMYDVNSLSGSVVLNGAFGTHPLTIHQNLIRENPLCMDVDDFLAHMDERLGGASEA